MKTKICQNKIIFNKVIKLTTIFEKSKKPNIELILIKHVLKST